MDIALILFYIFLLSFLIFGKKDKELYFLVVATIISFVWLLISRGQYSYNQNFLSIFGYSLYLFFSWSIGLFFVYLLFLLFEKIFKTKLQKFIFFLIIYWILLILAETIFYHYFNVHNIATSIYPGLPICNCMHAPSWTKIVYFSLGPIYYLALSLFKYKK